MGVLTDLVCATSSELAALSDDDIPINIFPGLDLKGTGLVELGALLAIAIGAELDPGLGQFPAVLGQDSEDGPWVIKFPDLLLSHLSSASALELKRIASIWVKTDELQAGNWQLSEAEARLAEMALFTRSAIERRTPVHIWMSL